MAVLLGVTPSRCLALGGNYGPEELKSRGTIGGPTPVHGYWVNSEDVFFCAGDAKAFNPFNEAYGNFKHRLLKVVIHRGPKQAASPWEKGGIAADWSLYVWNAGLPVQEEPRQDGERAIEAGLVVNPPPTCVDVWVGERLKLNELQIPAALEVMAGIDAAPDVEIQKFVAEHAARATSSPSEVLGEQHAGPIRVTLELDDGSRLRGETNDLKHLHLQTAVGKLTVGLEHVESIQFQAEQGTATVHFRNGDQLTGALDTADCKALKLLTIVGEITVPIRLVRRCTIEAAGRKAKVSVRASSSWETSVTENAFDGRLDTDWNAGTYAPAWIEAELSAPTQLASIVLLPGQDIPGATTHEIWVSAEP
ncbi:MAG TPA: discoidin domain-containing protein, partial [Pirellulales bacterium]|nr:discoidin domain-containing protein [Pirellulales bacterium]